MEASPPIEGTTAYPDTETPPYLACEPAASSVATPAVPEAPALLATLDVQPLALVPPELVSEQLEPTLVEPTLVDPTHAVPTPLASPTAVAPLTGSEHDAIEAALAIEAAQVGAEGLTLPTAQAPLAAHHTVAASCALITIEAAAQEGALQEGVGARAETAEEVTLLVPPQAAPLAQAPPQAPLAPVQAPLIETTLPSLPSARPSTPPLPPPEEEAGLAESSAAPVTLGVGGAVLAAGEPSAAAVDVAPAAGEPPAVVSAALAAGEPPPAAAVVPEVAVVKESGPCLCPSCSIM